MGLDISICKLVFSPDYGSAIDCILLLCEKKHTGVHLTVRLGDACLDIGTDMLCTKCCLDIRHGYVVQEVVFRY